MHDTRIKELLDAYLQHKLDFEEYRRLRTQHIDSLIGTRRVIAPEESNGDRYKETSSSIASQSCIRLRQNPIVFLGGIALLIIIIAVSLF